VRVRSRLGRRTPRVLVDHAAPAESPPPEMARLV
jgi:hypothetical protein